MNATANSLIGSYNATATVNLLQTAFALANTTKCDANVDAFTNLSDAQLMISQGLGQRHRCPI